MGKMYINNGDGRRTVGNADTVTGGKTPQNTMTPREKSAAQHGLPENLFDKFGQPDVEKMIYKLKEFLV